MRPFEELCHLDHRYNAEGVELARKHQLLGMPVPVEYGGRGADRRTCVRVLARIGREGTGIRTFLFGQSIGETPVVEWATEEQKERVLPEAAAGRRIMAFGLTEPEAGSNPRETQMTCRREGDVYRLNGVKYLVSNGSIADTIIVFAYPEDARGSARRFSAFILDTDRDCIEREMMTAKIGLPTSDTSMLELTDYLVPVGDMLGAEGAGLAIAMRRRCGAAV